MARAPLGFRAHGCARPLGFIKPELLKLLPKARTTNLQAVLAVAYCTYDYTEKERKSLNSAYRLTLESLGLSSEETHFANLSRVKLLRSARAA
ncbi:hypothetical protein [Bradyrhizobium elkanii]|jgi:hypothetical protein|uniref:Uncharacterized protein n=2 Tax=Bradyrhizobium TaxID=374 RepID=A0A8I1XZP0_BRAEL|nr:hypothetical protein [Bradyrhizobium elkanii]MBP1290342.1 hypothetical protein [Bradyrhizobium elkanii]MCP1975440.1 hypothetical protein [Bradyrhizobium elkanii]MCS3482510.1 hypothetical protein [Bradyrhizobium elkanii]MCS3525111.1 hypothetical protein [Bradyrhizobium elkanii]MCS4075986.1 hypothetical protein [Bradyrhizobium elkanii]